jgi:hypothetical protein
VCASNNNVTAGTKILLDPVEDGDQDASGKFRMISNETTNLEYIQSKLDGIEEFVRLKTVGIDDALTKEAINEKQVQGSFESRTNVLLKIKGNLDDVYIWIVRTIGEAFIKGKPLSIEANFGTEWYLITEEEIQKRFKDAKDAGMPTAELNELYFQLLDTKYKGNPEKIQRLKIMNMMDACPYDSTEEKVKKLQSGIISKTELIISERMITFVQKFEIENGSLTEFGSELDPKVKYQRIYEQLKKYADEFSRENDTEPPGSGSEGSE